VPCKPPPTGNVRALADHQALISDIRMPMVVTNFDKIDQLEGRVITHGEDEFTGRAYMILEGTDRKIHFIYHTVEIEQARYQGSLERNAFVRISGNSSGCIPAFEDLGDAESLLKNKAHLKKAAGECIKRGIMPPETGCGWLGKYEAAVSRACKEIRVQAQQWETGRPKHGRSR
jgi:hypothetical protein